MASLLRPGGDLTHAATRRRQGGPADALLLESHVTAVRVWRESGELRAHCRRQREMIAEQRELLRGLTQQHAFGDGATCAPEGAEDGRVRGEGTRAGE